MEVLPWTNGFKSTDFNLRFGHVAELLYEDADCKASFEAEGHFEAGVNMMGACGGSEVCGWELKEEFRPFAVVTDMVKNWLEVMDADGRAAEV